ncbi:MAG: hypothetical protein FWF31_10040 [Desulfobulbus sp.]|nr:hypothetical protein [Desulfobulbus sp.]
MAFTCRPEKHHEQILKRICDKHGFKIKQGALFHVVERYEEVEARRNEYLQRVRELERELAALKQAVRAKVDADENLLRRLQ